MDEVGIFNGPLLGFKDCCSAGGGEHWPKVSKAMVISVQVRGMRLAVVFFLSFLEVFIVVFFLSFLFWEGGSEAGRMKKEGLEIRVS